MLKSVLHTLPYLVCKEQAVICVNLVVKRCRILHLQVMVPACLQHRFSGLERVNARDGETGFGKVKLYSFVLYVLTLVYACREIEWCACPGFGITDPRLSCGCDMVSNIIAVVPVITVGTHIDIFLHTGAATRF